MLLEKGSQRIVRMRRLKRDEESNRKRLLVVGERGMMGEREDGEWRGEWREDGQEIGEIREFM